jgi:predicted nuclease of predicted toxin-antitoxin system
MSRLKLVARLGSPPQLLWITCGNVVNRRLQSLFVQVFPKALVLLAAGESIVELADLEKEN